MRAHDFLYLSDVLRAGDTVLFSDHDHLVVWSGGTIANVYTVEGPSVLRKVDCFSFGHGLDRVSQARALRLAAEAATKSWLKARDEEMAELDAEFHF